MKRVDIEILELATSGEGAGESQVWQQRWESIDRRFEKEKSSDNQVIIVDTSILPPSPTFINM